MEFLKVKISASLNRYRLRVFGIGLFLTMYGFLALLLALNLEHEHEDEKSILMRCQIKFLMQIILAISLLYAAWSKLVILLITWIGFNYIFVAVTVIMTIFYDDPLGFSSSLGSSLLWFSIRIIEVKIVAEYTSLGIKQLRLEHLNHVQDQLQQVVFGSFGSTRRYG